MIEALNVLSKIVLHKRKEVAQRKLIRSYETLLRGLQVSKRSLEQVLRQSGNRFILEYKRASPSEGTINSTLTVDDVCEAYQGFADAVSVLTDQTFFDGSFEHLRQLKNKMDVPVLCKDFILEPYQVIEARYYGADAILLMLSILDDQQYQTLAALADDFSLDVLTEVHTEAELQRAVQLGARIIGINNRNMNTLQTDIAVTEKLASKVPADRLVISESGISSRKDILRLTSKVDGFLVGTSLTSSKDVRGAVKRLLFGEVKICGIKNSKDAGVAEIAGASYLGLVFYTPSPRFVTIEEAEIITESVCAKFVGVFVNSSVETMVDSAKRLNLFAVQCHGNESPELLANLKQQLPRECQLWKALGYAGQSTFQQIAQIEALVDRVLVDYQNTTIGGGSGRRFNWQEIDNIQISIGDPHKLVVAGGIAPSNVHELDAYPDLSIDLSSGVESTLGVKSIDKIKRLFDRRRCTSKERQVVRSQSQRRAV
ncbi:MAG: bifunctional indole-3-glycerol-phosphate synthase TrpC/phosphoribosylanthranilate isomerase TrpF [Gammaproteobacteria bacterium]|jgi:indole-3-glycerol phosphate synthase / phosphoribosylanthranilate isomerase|nr:bifunctional indole-3-glycerol-phosphate synthase TrpC/phosphoribosylanthranilate isomerase TrpF [Gammaproteobacteria bacterium]